MEYEKRPTLRQMADQQLIHCQNDEQASLLPSTYVFPAVLYKYLQIFPEKKLTSWNTHSTVHSRMTAKTTIAQ